MAKVYTIVQSLRLMGSGHWHGLGDDWVKARANEAADEIERLERLVAWLEAREKKLHSRIDGLMVDAKERAGVVLSEENDRLIDEIRRLKCAAPSSV